MGAYPLLPSSMVIANVAASAPAGALETTEPIVLQVTSPAGPTANEHFGRSHAA